ncbi:50S ribosomal protein L32 [bacterium]|nr:50S ribosomal protein L32 [bacterium]
MGVPKKKQSRCRTRRRKAQWLSRGGGAVTLTPCPECRQPRRSHRICPHCGSYGRVRATDSTGETT